MDQRPPTQAILGFAAVLAAVLGVLLVTRPADRVGLSATRPITYRVDVNTADAQTLCLLPGIGPGLARRVIQDRWANGRFADAADLERVPFIGKKTRVGFEPWITVGRESNE